MKYTYTPWIEGKRATVYLENREYTRVVRHRRDCGLYIVIKKTMYFEYEFEYVEMD